jgi:hypothetical protein
MDVKKIVNLTPEQYQELLETGQVEVDGVIKTKEDGVLYDTGYLEFIEWYNKIMEAQYNQTAVNHTPMAMKSLEQEYKDIVGEEMDPGTDGDTLAYMSAIGYTAILKNGDTIKVTEPNKGVFYINGSVVTNDYTYIGDGYEVVNVWVFEDKYNLELNDTPTFNIPELDVRNIATTPVVGDGYKKYASTIRAYNFTISGSTTRKLISNGTESFNQSSIASIIEEVESDCTTYNIFRAGMYNHGNLKKVVFNNLTQITSEQGNFVCGCTNPDLEIVFPNIKTLNGNGNISLFDKVCNVVIPKSAVRLTSRICSDNQTITLNCNKATIDNIWCGSAPKINFTMCSDWQASINISVAAKNHTIDWFIDLFTNKLAEVTPGSKEINIPIAIYDAMSDSEEDYIAIAENKGWIVGGV